MLNIVLVEPEIPQNAGNIARTCACTGSRLHLIEPMGFRPTEKNLKRAGCNYWNDVDIVRWPYLGAFLEAHGEDELNLFTGAVSRTYAEVAYGPDAFLLFGRESRGRAQSHGRRARLAQRFERGGHRRLRGPAPAGFPRPFLRCPAPERQGALAEAPRRLPSLFAKVFRNFSVA